MKHYEAATFTRVRENTLRFTSHFSSTSTLNLGYPRELRLTLTLVSLMIHLANDDDSSNIQNLFFTQFLILLFRS